VLQGFDQFLALRNVVKLSGGISLAYQVYLLAHKGQTLLTWIQSFWLTSVDGRHFSIRCKNVDLCFKGEKRQLLVTYAGNS
jgi:hypothetical protein